MCVRTLKEIACARHARWRLHLVILPFVLMRETASRPRARRRNALANFDALVHVLVGIFKALLICELLLRHRFQLRLKHVMQIPVDYLLEIISH